MDRSQVYEAQNTQDEEGLQPSFIVLLAKLAQRVPEDEVMPKLLACLFQNPS
jgi:hypothetical protein